MIDAGRSPMPARIRAWLALVALGAAGAAAGFTPPASLSVVTDFDYPPFLFRTDDGALKGIVRDKWDLWSRTTGVPVTVKGATWLDAQNAVGQGADDVIETLAYTPERAALYEFSEPYAPVAAHVYFHRNISAISDVASMRGFTIGAKEGSACGAWLAERGVTLREYPKSEALVHAAGTGEVKLFCMDSMTARYYLYKLLLADDFRASPPLYTTNFHWAVRKGQAELRDFIAAGFARVPAGALADIDAQWIGNPLRFPLAERFLFYLAGIAVLALVLYAALIAWNRSLRRRVAARTAELDGALLSLRQATGAGNVGLFDYDLVTDRVAYSPQWKQQIGHAAHEIGDSPDEWRERLHPEDRDRVVQEVQRCTERPPHECRLEYRFRHKDGSYRWILVQAAVLFGAAGAPVRVVGSHVDITDHKRNEALLAGQARVHELLATGAPLEVSLDSLLRVVEAQAPGMLSSILLLDDDGMHVRHCAAPTLAPAFCRAIDGEPIGPAAGSCGTAMYRRTGVIVEDIALDPLWVRYRDLALAHGLRAGWSTPILDAHDNVLGSFALYFTEPRRPDEFHQRLIRLVTHCASIAITQRREQRALAESEERLRLAVTGARLGTWRLDMRTRTLTCSDATRALCGLPPGAPFPMGRFLQLVHPADRPELDAGLVRALKRRASYESEFRVVHPDGSAHWLALRGRAYAVGERTVRMEGIAFDITERKAADERISRLDRVHAFLSSVNSVIVRVRDDRELVQEACRLAVAMGRFRAAWLALDEPGGGTRITATAGVDDELLAVFEAALDEPAVVASAAGAGSGVAPRIVDDIAHDPPSARLRDALVERGIHGYAVLPLVVEGATIGRIALYAGTAGAFDATERQLLDEIAGDIAFGLDHIRKEERITLLAYYDPLTGLANRALFEERLAALVETARTEGSRLALCIADLDHFKDVNDALGRHNGDLLLVELARRLRGCVDKAEWLARLGSDSFAFVLPKIDAGGDLAALYAGHLERCTGAPFRLSADELHVSARFGVALFPADGADAEALYRHAEAALKYAKARGERVSFYHAHMTERVGERVALESRLRRALENDEFELLYQPKVDATRRTVTGLEALLRWRDPRGGLVLPATIVPTLEDTGMIVEVGAWVIRRALADHASWLARGLAVPRIAVNVSAEQLRQRDFVDLVRHALHDAGVASMLDLEITESVIMRDVENNVEKLRAIRDLGVKIAIDDFGTGYSSLGYLARLPVQVLKIDVSFTARMTQDENIATLVTTMISLAHSLGLTVVAEGVETAEQAAALQRMGCDELQGYLLGIPLARDQVVTLLEGRARRRSA